MSIPRSRGEGDRSNWKRHVFLQEFGAGEHWDKVDGIEGFSFLSALAPLDVLSTPFEDEDLREVKRKTVSEDLEMVYRICHMLQKIQMAFGEKGRKDLVPLYQGPSFSLEEIRQNMNTASAEEDSLSLQLKGKDRSNAFPRTFSITDEKNFPVKIERLWWDRDASEPDKERNPQGQTVVLGSATAAAQVLAFHENLDTRDFSQLSSGRHFFYLTSGKFSVGNNLNSGITLSGRDPFFPSSSPLPALGSSKEGEIPLHFRGALGLLAAWSGTTPIVMGGSWHNWQKVSTSGFIPLDTALYEKKTAVPAQSYPTKRHPPKTNFGCEVRKADAVHFLEVGSGTGFVPLLARLLAIRRGSAGGIDAKEGAVHLSRCAANAVYESLMYGVFHLKWDEKNVRCGNVKKRKDTLNMLHLHAVFLERVFQTYEAPSLLALKEELLLLRDFDNPFRRSVSQEGAVGTDLMRSITEDVIFQIFEKPDDVTGKSALKSVFFEQGVIDGGFEGIREEEEASPSHLKTTHVFYDAFLASDSECFHTLCGILLGGARYPRFRSFCTTIPPQKVHQWGFLEVSSPSIPDPEDGANNDHVESSAFVLRRGDRVLQYLGRTLEPVEQRTNYAIGNLGGAVDVTLLVGGLGDHLERQKTFYHFYRVVPWNPSPLDLLMEGGATGLVSPAKVLEPDLKGTQVEEKNLSRKTDSLPSFASVKRKQEQPPNREKAFNAVLQKALSYLSFASTPVCLAIPLWMEGSTSAKHRIAIQRAAGKVPLALASRFKLLYQELKQDDVDFSSVELRKDEVPGLLSQPTVKSSQTGSGGSEKQRSNRGAPFLSFGLDREGLIDLSSDVDLFFPIEPASSQAVDMEVDMETDEFEQEEEEEKGEEREEKGRTESLSRKSSNDEHNLPPSDRNEIFETPLIKKTADLAKVRTTFPSPLVGGRELAFSAIGGTQDRVGALLPTQMEIDSLSGDVRQAIISDVVVFTHNEKNVEQGVLWLPSNPVVEEGTSEKASKRRKLNNSKSMGVGNRETLESRAGPSGPERVLLESEEGPSIRQQRLSASLGVAVLESMVNLQAVEETPFLEFAEAIDPTAAPVASTGLLLQSGGEGSGQSNVAPKVETPLNSVEGNESSLRGRKRRVSIAEVLSKKRDVELFPQEGKNDDDEQLRSILEIVVSIHEEMLHSDLFLPGMVVTRMTTKEDPSVSPVPSVQRGRGNVLLVKNLLATSSPPTIVNAPLERPSSSSSSERKPDGLVVVGTPSDFSGAIPVNRDDPDAFENWKNFSFFADQGWLSNSVEGKGGVKPKEESDAKWINRTLGDRFLRFRGSVGTFNFDRWVEPSAIADRGEREFVFWRLLVANQSAWMVQRAMQLFQSLMAEFSRSVLVDPSFLRLSSAQEVRQYLAQRGSKWFSQNLLQREEGVVGNGVGGREEEKKDLDRMETEEEEMEEKKPFPGFFTKKGKCIFLREVHLAEGWVPDLEPLQLLFDESFSSSAVGISMPGGEQKLPLFHKVVPDPALLSSVNRVFPVIPYRENGSSPLIPMPRLLENTAWAPWLFDFPTKADKRNPLAFSDEMSREVEEGSPSGGALLDLYARPLDWTEPVTGAADFVPKQKGKWLVLHFSGGFVFGLDLAAATTGCKTWWRPGLNRSREESSDVISRYPFLLFTLNERTADEFPSLPFCDTQEFSSETQHLYQPTNFYKAEEAEKIASLWVNEFKIMSLAPSDFDAKWNF